MLIQGGGVTTSKFDRILPLCLPYLPTTTRTRNEGVRPYLFGPEVFDIFLKNQFLDGWTTMETYRPQNLNMYIVVHEESKFLVPRR